MLKYTIDTESFELLNDVEKTFYAQSGEGYQLQVEGATDKSKLDAISRGAHLGRGVKARAYGIATVENSNTIIQNLIGTVAELPVVSRRASEIKHR